MGVLGNNALVGASAAGAGGAGGEFYSHQITNSCRFLLANSSYMYRTPSVAGNRRTWTFSTWIKRTKFAINTSFFGATRSGYENVFRFDDSDNVERLNTFGFTGASTDFNVKTTASYRDPSAWMHIVIAMDTTQGTASDRLKLYVNGELITDLANNTYPSQDYDTNVNDTSTQTQVGFGSYGGQYFDGYMAESVLIDGTQYAASDFGETKNNVWIPKDPSGLTFGTNGFYLKYESSSDLGNDSSGNNNDFTVSGLSAHDQMLDTPTFNSSSNGGNFATWNPLNAGSYTTLAEGNLKATGTSSDASNPSGTFAMRSGKWYWEMLVVDEVASYPYLGLTVLGNITNSPTTGGDIWAMRYDIGSGSLGGNSGANITGLGTLTTTSTGVTTATDGDIISFYLDCDNRKAWIAKNGTIPNSGNPATGANPQWSWTTTPSNPITFTAQVYNGDDTILNAGQDGTFAGEKTAQGNSDDTGYGNFYYAPPTGFLAMCSGNLPISAQIDPAQNSDDYPQQLFDAQLWTGDGNSGRSITISGAKKPSLSVIKQRNSSNGWNVWTQGYNSGDYDSFGEFNSTGAWNANQGVNGPYTADPTASALTLTAYGQVNGSSNTYVNYRWVANGGTTVTNSNGSTDSTVEVDPSGHFSVVTFEGQNDSWGNAETIGHGLSSAPTCMILKNMDKTDEWAVFFSDYGDYSIGGSNAACNSLVLNSDAALYTNQSYKGFGGVMPTSTVFTVDGNNNNGAGESIVVFCFANCEGYIKVGTYVGNGNADGAFVYTGFEPEFFMCKPLPAGNWRIKDIERSPYNVTQQVLYPNHTYAEENYTSDNVDILSNGIKMRASDTTFNQATTYVYLAMAHNPFKYSLAR